MNRETILGLLFIGCIASQWFIHAEKPVWLYPLEKWLRFGGENGRGERISFFSVLFFIFIVSTLSENDLIMSSASFILLFLCITFYAASCIFTILNALLPPQQKGYVVATVIDSFVYRISSRRGPTRYGVLIKASIPGMGIRVLPPLSYDGIEYRPKTNLSIFYRRGCFGYLYRLTFDP